MLTPETEFEPASGWNRSDLDVLNHEVAHAQVADFLSVKILEVRIDNPMNRETRGPDPRGRCTTAKIVGEDAWKHICIDLAPLVVENRAPQAPPSLDTAERGDEMNIAKLCYELEISPERYAALLSFTEAILEYPPSREKGRVLSRALLEFGALPGDRVEALFAESKLRAMERPLPIPLRKSSRYSPRRRTPLPPVCACRRHWGGEVVLYLLGAVAQGFLANA